jgi:hypothetical protein
MILSDLSARRLRKTFETYDVDEDYANPMYNYLVHGYGPGSFFTAILCNDFMRAMQCSHPANTIPALKRLSSWIFNEMPPEAWGSPAQVQEWIELEPDARRAILERRGLVYTPKEETFYAIKESA